MHAPLVPSPDPAGILAPLGLPLTPNVAALARDLAPADDERLEEMAVRARALTRRHFGKTVRLFAPLYLSNECINSCAYCGFSRENAILRVTLEAEQVRAEARHLAEASGVAIDVRRDAFEVPEPLQEPPQPYVPAAA